MLGYGGQEMKSGFTKGSIKKDATPHCVWLLISHNMLGYGGQIIP